MSLKVIGAGLGRTGTYSLKVALEKLTGEPCYHMAEVFRHLDHVPTWLAAANGDSVNWEALMQGYGAAVDWPVASFWPEMSKAFPDALILVSTRNAESWWESAHQTIFEATSHMTGDEMKDWLEMVHALFRNRFTMEITDREACIAAFEKHYEDVLSTVPADRRLVWNVKDGWEPICKALNVPIPDEPFPITNTRQEFIERFEHRGDEVPTLATT